MEQFINFIEQNQIWFIIGLVAFSLFLFIVFLVQGFRIRKWEKKYYKMMGGKNYKSLEEMLTKHNHQVGKILESVEDTLERQKRVDQKLDLCVHKVGVVRYNAFNDMGSDLSYSIALLDGNDNGVIISGIHGRDFCNTYAKPIVNGKSTYKLTAEEVLAMDRSQKESAYA